MLACREGNPWPSSQFTRRECGNASLAARFSVCRDGRFSVWLGGRIELDHLARFQRFAMEGVETFERADARRIIARDLPEAFTRTHHMRSAVRRIGIRVVLRLVGIYGR